MNPTACAVGSLLPMQLLVLGLSGPARWQLHSPSVTWPGCLLASWSSEPGALQAGAGVARGGHCSCQLLSRAGRRDDSHAAARPAKVRLCDVTTPAVLLAWATHLLAAHASPVKNVPAARTPPWRRRATRRRLPMPTLLLWGEKDPALGQQASRCQPCHSQGRWPGTGASAAPLRTAMLCATHPGSRLPLPPLSSPSPQLMRGTERYVESLRVEVLQGAYAGLYRLAGQGSKGQLRRAGQRNQVAPVAAPRSQPERSAPAAPGRLPAGCSHWAQQDQPQRVNALMAEFLAE